MIDAKQIHAARVLLAWSQQDLADRAIISVSTVIRLEGGTVDARSSTVNAVKSALEKAGIQFLSDGEMIGVLLRIKKKSSAGRGPSRKLRRRH
jgi:predicted transcriptional regulator